MKEQENTSQAELEKLIDVLAKQAARIRELEQNADRFLHEENDTVQYKALLQDKAEILSGLSELAQPYVENLSANLREKVARQLESLAHNALQAINVDSVFFMRQLLYPEDYEQGQENDLERFISSLRQIEG